MGAIFNSVYVEMDADEFHGLMKSLRRSKRVRLSTDSTQLEVALKTPAYYYNKGQKALKNFILSWLPYF